MTQRLTATVFGIALAILLLVNFRGPEAAALALQPVGRTPAGGGTASGGTAGSGGAGGTTTGTGGAGGGTSGGAGGAGTGGSAGSGQGTGSGATASGTFTGQDYQFFYGDVQVQVTLKNGKITDVQALSMPTGGHSGRISSYVAPILRQQALTAQSATIDGVSGATFTSEAYAASLQSALTAAGL